MTHLGTKLSTFPELVEQLGIMRYGHRPRWLIPFAVQDKFHLKQRDWVAKYMRPILNPIASMLTWGAFNIVGGSKESREKLDKDQQKLTESRSRRKSIGSGIEKDRKGWQAKSFLYCVEVRCPQTGGWFH